MKAGEDDKMASAEAADKSMPKSNGTPALSGMPIRRLSILERTVKSRKLTPVGLPKVH